MLKLFCPQCGAKFEYTLKVPNFCKFCREPLTVEAAKIKPREEDIEESSIQEAVKPLSHSEKLRQRLAAKRAQIEDDETELEDEDDNFIPKPGKIEISVVSKKKETLADLAVGAKVDREAKRESGPLAFKNQKQFERDFRKLAGKTRE